MGTTQLKSATKSHKVWNYFVRRSIEQNIVIGLVGTLVEALMVEGEVWKRGLGHDVDQIDRLIGSITRPYLKDRAAYIKETLGPRAEEMIDRPGFWSAVEAVKEALLQERTLSGKRAEEIMRRAIDEVANA